MNEAFTKHLPKVDYESPQVMLLNLCHVLRSRCKVGLIMREVFIGDEDTACAYTTLTTEENSRGVSEVVNSRFHGFFEAKVVRVPDVNPSRIVFFIPKKRQEPAEELKPERKFERLLKEIEDMGGENEKATA